MKKIFILFMALGFIISCSFAEAAVVSRDKENTKLEQKKCPQHKKKTQTQKCQKSENQDNQKKKEDTNTQKK